MPLTPKKYLNDQRTQELINEIRQRNPATFVGTTAEWNALTAAQKAKYVLVNLTDDIVDTDKINDISGSLRNPNLLDNPWFTVNQIEFTGPNESRGITVDRWYSDKGTTFSNGIITQEKVAGAGGSTNLYQNAELSLVESLFGKTVTLSVMLADGTVKSITGTCRTRDQLVDNWNNFLQSNRSLDLGNNIYAQLYAKYDLANNVLTGAQFPIIRVSGAPDGTTISIKAVKLELGSISTLANDIEPNYAEELAKCQRYCMVFDPKMYHIIGHGMLLGAKLLYFSMPTPVSMRDVTSVSIPSFMINYKDGVNLNVETSEVKYIRTTKNGVTLHLIPTADITYTENAYVEVVTNNVDKVILATDF